MKKLILLSFLTLLVACQNSKIDYTYPENPENIRKQRAGKFFDNDGVVGGKKTGEQKAGEQKPNEQKKAHPLWLSSVGVISSLLPISAVDESSGLIITEWYQDGQNKNERIKINLLVKGKEIKPENLLLTIFKQTKNNKGDWQDESVSDKNLSGQLIVEKIIKQAQLQK